MISAPQTDAVYSTYEDQLEALAALFHARARLAADPNSRFSGMSSHEIQERLEWDRKELERWVVMMLVASFEASIRTDAARRIQSRSRDSVRLLLRNLFDTHDDRVRLVDILAIWDDHVSMRPAKRAAVRALLKHRHWLAHGRHWTNKHGAIPGPPEARACLIDYVQAIRAEAADFPRR